MLQAALLLLNFACDATFICYNTVEQCRTDLQKYKCDATEGDSNNAAGYINIDITF